MVHVSTSDGDRPIHLRAWRLRRAWSQQDLADAAGVRRATITEVENGKRNPRPSTVRKLAKALGLKPEQLFEGPV